MNTDNRKFLKDVLEAVPAGYLVDAAWLTSHGIPYETFRDYVKRGWLKRVHRGVFRRPTPIAMTSEPIDWKMCLLSMQHIMGYDVHVGGMSALNQQGYEHYLRLGENAPVWVYGNDIPNWLAKLPLNAPVETRRPSLFNTPSLGLTEDDQSSSGVLLPWDWKLRMSTPEKAVMEVMNELPEHESFHNLDMVFESLTTLRPKLLTELLNSCKKIKVKRLFFVFAERHAHPWSKQLNPDDFNLGSGDRGLVKGGRIHPKFRIMVPNEFVKSESFDGP